VSIGLCTPAEIAARLQCQTACASYYRYSADGMTNGFPVLLDRMICWWFFFVTGVIGIVI